MQNLSHNESLQAREKIAPSNAGIKQFDTTHPPEPAVLPCHRFGEGAVDMLAINVALAALRFAWAWISLHFTLARATRRGQKPYVPSWRLIAATSVAGVRGAITLAGVLTLPFVMNDGSPFPARDLAIFLAAAVIILSLIVASIALPRLLEGLQLPPEPSTSRRRTASGSPPRKPPSRR